MYIGHEALKKIHYLNLHQSDEHERYSMQYCFSMNFFYRESLLTEHILFFQHIKKYPFRSRSKEKPERKEMSALNKFFLSRTEEPQEEIQTVYSKFFLQIKVWLCSSWGILWPELVFRRVWCFWIAFWLWDLCFCGMFNENDFYNAFTMTKSFATRNIWTWQFIKRQKKTY